MTAPKLRRIRRIETSRALSSANLVATSNTTLADVPGLVQDVVPGTYYYRLRLQVTANVSGGTKAAIKQNNGATLSAHQNTTSAYAAAAVAVTQTTSTTDAASLVAATAAHLLVISEGTFTVATPGTLQIQAAQNASNASATTVLAGSTFLLTRID